LPQASPAATLSEASAETAPRALQSKCRFSIERRPRAHRLTSSCTKQTFATSTKAPSEPRFACRLRVRLGKTLRKHNESNYFPIADMPQVTGLNGYLKAAADDTVHGRWLGWGVPGFACLAIRDHRVLDRR
jgi:hypothetical protein